MKFQGSLVAIVTPFRKDESVDFERLEQLVDFHIRNGTSALVPCGTTGESPTLTMQEHKEVVAFVIRQARGRLPVVAGTGSNCTAEAVELTRAAADAGAQASLQVAPYYNKPEPEGMFLHFKTIAEKTRLPMIVYNIPGRTGREVALETMLRLADEVPEVVAVKEASGSMDRSSELCQRTRLTVLSGDDSLTLPIMAVGGSGVISVAANLIPRDIARFTALAAAGDMAGARESHLRLFPVFKAMFIEANPIPVKTAMAMLGLCGGAMRLPLSPMRPDSAERLREALQAAGLFNK